MRRRMVRRLEVRPRNSLWQGEVVALVGFPSPQDRRIDCWHQRRRASRLGASDKLPRDSPATMEIHLEPPVPRVAGHVFDRICEARADSKDGTAGSRGTSASQLTLWVCQAIERGRSYNDWHRHRLAKNSGAK